MAKAEITRLLILQKAFELIYTRGYQATSVDEIIATTNVTKGAFYYHFGNKEEMGLAVIREIMYPGMTQALIEPLLNSERPLEDIYRMMKNLLLSNPFFQVKYGCPAVNLIEEMAALNPAFSKALGALVSEWQDTIRKSVTQGRLRGTIRKNVNPKQVALFISIGYSGVRNLGKIYGKDAYESYLKELKQYLNSLAREAA